MSPRLSLSTRCVALALLAAAVLLPAAALAQMVMNEGGFSCVQLTGDFAKQAEIGVGPDTCLYYGSFDGLKRRCAVTDIGTVCDPTLTFPVGIAFSTGGSFGSYMYVADYGVGDIHRSSGCGPTTTFATISGPGAIAFPPSGSPFGNYLYACVAFDGPLQRVSSTGVVTTWLDLGVAYLKFGPGGAWGTSLYATQYFEASGTGLVKITSAGAVTPLCMSMLTPEGFDWGFDGDLFATDASLGEVYRVKPNGTKTLFATVGGAADVAYRAGEQALYVVSNQGGLYKVVRGTTTDVSDAPLAGRGLDAVPNPTRGACAVRFALRAGGLTRADVLDAAGRVVRRLGDVWRPAGAQSLAWDGRDAAGVPVRAGNYFVQVVAEGDRRATRVTVVR